MVTLGETECGLHGNFLYSLQPGIIQLFKDKKPFFFLNSKTITTTTKKKRCKKSLSHPFFHLPSFWFSEYLPQINRLVLHRQLVPFCSRPVGACPYLLPSLSGSCGCWLLETPVALQLMALLSAWRRPTCQEVSAPRAPSAGAEGSGEYTPSSLRPQQGN